MKKKILGIAALLAVLAMCLTFTACPKDEEERSVTFVNNLKIGIDITIKGGPTFSLAGLANASAKADKREVTKKGEDIVIMTISFDQPLVQADPGRYIVLDGDLVAGKNKTGADAQGLALSYGFLYFNPNLAEAQNPAGFKIGTILLDD